MKYYSKRKRNKGMRIGASHKWKYNTGTWNETKIGKRKWKFQYEQTKSRLGKTAPYGSGMPIGSKLIWNIKAKQYAIKVTPNKYRLIMRGIKTQDNAQIKGKWINKRRRYLKWK